LIAKEISGRVIVAYCRAPTTDLNKEGPEKVSEPTLVSLSPDCIGVEMGIRFQHIGSGQ